MTLYFFRSVYIKYIVSIRAKVDTDLGKFHKYNVFVVVFNRINQQKCISTRLENHCTRTVQSSRGGCSQ